ncbi:heat shock 70 kDa protein II-like isoform X2 [Corticium candelabrum]|uniref:heat shock 70 kDa protein II-like isoform X2 n=1 Tax=Corticium candelabrum TaxID=121492 RepID=UPI002E2664A4|nr:heat shock 70 kDa protein II-like isoform X2 [Corticium candelabrum]
MAGVGIYFGSTSACLALFKNGRVEVLSDDSGERTTPTCVTLIGGEMLVGVPARQRLVRYPESCLSNIKQFIGKQNFDLRSQLSSCDSQVQHTAGNLSITLKNGNDSKQFGVLQLATAVFKKLRETAVSGGCSADSSIAAVVAAPSYFTCEQRQEIRSVAESAGFAVLRVISEPSAAVLAYGLLSVGQSDGANSDSQCFVSCYVLVYHLGGSSLDLTILEYINGLYKVLTSQHITDLGGQLFDAALTDYFRQEFQRSARVELEAGGQGIRKLQAVVENTKKILSTLNQAAIAVDMLHEGMDFQSTISRARFEDLCAAEFIKCTQPIDDVMKTAEIEKSSITYIVLSGGATRMPRIKQILKQMFLNAEILESINPEEVVAQGAATEVGILLHDQLTDMSVDSTTQLDCAAHSFVAVVAGTDGASPVIPIVSKQSLLPVTSKITLDLSSQGEPTAILLYESESCEKLVDERLIGEIKLQPNSDHRKSEDLTIELLSELTRQCGLSVRVYNRSTDETAELIIPALS